MLIDDGAGSDLRIDPNSDNTGFLIAIDEGYRGDRGVSTCFDLTNDQARDLAAFITFSLNTNQKDREMTDRPTIQMNKDAVRATTPDWIRRAQANAAQINEACDVAQATYNLVRKSYDLLLEERAYWINTIGTLPEGSPRTSVEERILEVQRRIVAKRHQLDPALRDLEALRQEKMRVIR